MTKNAPLSESPHVSIVASALPEAHRIELFVSLLGQHQHQIHRYLLSLVPHAHDADDLLQNTNLFLWREFHKFQEGTNFISWGCAVAYNEVLAWRKRKSRDRLVFSEAFLEAVSGQIGMHSNRLELQSRALALCVEELRDNHRQLLKMRYADSGSIEAISGSLGRSSEAVYRMLSRIRRILYDCISRKVEMELAS
ncbi:MAG: sigma-70 family RNA polymerase sigma factor [Aureliella sp.]